MTVRLWVSYDHETRRFKQRLQTPRVVLSTTAQPGRPPRLHHGIDAMRRAFDAIFSRSDVGVCGVNIAYDLRGAAVWLDREREVEALYAAGRVLDLGLFEVLLGLAGKGRIRTSAKETKSAPSLQKLCAAYGVPFVNKADPETEAIRTSFGRFEFPAVLPPAHAAYALADSAVGLPIVAAQLEAASHLFRDSLPHVPLRVATRLAHEHYWLARWAADGIETDPAQLDAYEAAARPLLEAQRRAGWEHGLVCIRAENGRAWSAAGLPIDHLPPSPGHRKGVLNLRLDSASVRRMGAQAGLFGPPVEDVARDLTERLLSGERIEGWGVKIDTKRQLELLKRDCAVHGRPLPLGKPIRDKVTRKLRPATVTLSGKAWRDAVDKGRLVLGPELSAFMSYKTLQKAVDTVIPSFRDYGKHRSRMAKHKPGDGPNTYILHPRINFTDTLRVAPGAPNVANLSKASAAGKGSPGERECLLVPDGWVVLVADFPSLEEVTRAATLEALGQPSLADRCVRGWDSGVPYDAHSTMVAAWQGYSYEEALRLKAAKDKKFKGLRDKAKAMTFALPVGASEQVMADGSGATLEEAGVVRAAWCRANPADAWVQSNWSRIAGMIDRSEDGKRLYALRCHGTGHVVTRRTYTQSLNCNFQPAGAAVLQCAVLRLGPAIWIGSEDFPALRGARWMQCTHDELAMAVPRERAVSAALELEALMQEAACEALGDRVGRVLRPECVILRRYSKDEQAFVVPELQAELDGQRVAWHDARNPQWTPRCRLSLDALAAP